MVMKYRVISGWVTCNGPTFGDLTFEQRHYGAGAAENVAESPATNSVLLVSLMD